MPTGVFDRALLPRPYRGHCCADPEEYEVFMETFLCTRWDRKLFFTVRIEKGVFVGRTWQAVEPQGNKPYDKSMMRTQFSGQGRLGCEGVHRAQSRMAVNTFAGPLGSRIIPLGLTTFTCRHDIFQSWRRHLNHGHGISYENTRMVRGGATPYLRIQPSMPRSWRTVEYV